MIFKAASELQTKACNANKFHSVPSNIFLSVLLNMNVCFVFTKKDSVNFNESGHLSFSDRLMLKIFLSPAVEHITPLLWLPVFQRTYY